MSTLFRPSDETPERWRKSILGVIACSFGWHFGQIADFDCVYCAGCSKSYLKEGLVTGLVKDHYLLPRRCELVLQDTTKEIDIQINFVGYKCIDCGYIKNNAEIMVRHSKKWHGWRLAWKRLKDS